MLEMTGPWPWVLPVAIYPQHTNRRLAGQRGLFTIHGERPDPIEVTCARHVRRVPIPTGAIAAVRQVLAIGGLDDYRMFPDSDGLARALIEKHRLGTRPAPTVDGVNDAASVRGVPTRPGPAVRSNEPRGGGSKRAR